MTAIIITLRPLSDKVDLSSETIFPGIFLFWTSSKFVILVLIHKFNKAAKNHLVSWYLINCDPGKILHNVLCVCVVGREGNPWNGPFQYFFFIYQSEIQHGCHFRTKFNIKPCGENVKIVLSETTESFESKPG